MKEGMIVELDERTKKWFESRPGHVSTVVECKICGRFYKPSLGHVGCHKKKSRSNTAKD